MKQLALKFNNTPSYAKESYVVGQANESAYSWLMSWPHWHGVFGALIMGEKGSGKTHLCHMFANAKKAHYLNGQTCSIQHPFDYKGDGLYVIDDAHYTPLPWLFHFYNHLKSNQGCLVLATNQPLREWCKLKDLYSRLSTFATFELLLPDEKMIIGIMRKMLDDRGLHVKDLPLAYLARRIDRSYAHLSALVDQLDKINAQEKKQLTIALAKAIELEDL